MTTADVVIVSSRLPGQAPDGPAGAGLPVTDGLFDALSPVARELGATWVGGVADEAAAPTPERPTPERPEADLATVPVALTPPQLRDERDGCSGSILWPLYHDIGVADDLDPADWAHYVAVNAAISGAVADTAGPGALVWMHGHQLQLTPRMVRKLRPDLRIGLCLHVPFPPHSLFERLPWRRQLLLGLMGADVLGLPAPTDAHNLVRCVRAELGCQGGTSGLLATDGRAVRVRSHPAAVHTAGLAALAASSATTCRAAEMRSALGNPRQVFVGISRLDHSTGLVQRMQAFAELYADGALDPGETTFVQAVTPSKDRPLRTRALAQEVDRAVGDINARYGHLGRAPLTYLSRHCARDERVALLRLADVMVATPLRGGMGLAAKEYIACRPADEGALVLSEFTAAAGELTQAYLVNPYDIDAFKRALLAAATDPRDVRAERMRALRRQVWRRDARRWAEDFLSDLTTR